MKYFLFIITGILLQHLTHAQQIVIKSNNKFVHNEKVYSFNDLGPILSEVAEAHQWYAESNKANANAKVYGLSTIMTGGVGLLLLITSLEDGAINRGPVTTIGGTLIFSVPILGIAALINKAKAIKKRKYAIDAFNNASQVTMSKYRDPFSLSIDATASELRFVIHF